MTDSIETLIPEVVEAIDIDPLSPEEAALIDESVEFINETAAAVVNAAIGIGEHLLTRFFNNDIELATSRNPYKKTSYKMLCERPDLMVTQRELGSMIRVAAQERFFRSIELNTCMLSYTHQKYLTRLPDTETKAALAEECIQTGLPSRQLYNRISEIKNQSEPEAPHPAEQLFKENISHIDQAMVKIKMPDIFKDPNAIVSLTGEARAALKQKAILWVDELENFQAQCEILIQTLNRFER